MDSTAPHPAGPRRIAMVGPFPPLRGGIAHFNAHAAGALEARGHAVRRVSFRRLYPGMLFPGRSPFEPGGTPDGSARLDAVGPRTWMGVARDVRRWAPDATVAAYWTPPLAPAVGTVARHSGAWTIGLVHNASPHERMPGARALARWFLARCDGVITLSAGVAAAVRELGFEGPLSTTPHPIYDRFGSAPPRLEARRRLALAPESTLLLFFGLVRPYKGLDVLVEALPSVMEKRQDVRLVVAGEWYGSTQPIMARIAELGIGGAIEVRNAYIPDADVPGYFAASDVVVLPYRAGTQSGVLTTAARYGIPVVVSDVGGIGEPVRRFGAGRVVEPGDPQALAAAILEVLSPGSRPPCVEGASRLAAAHGWDPFCETVESMIRGGGG